MEMPMRHYEVKPFDVEVRRFTDEEADLSYLGTFSDEWKPGAIVHDGPVGYKYFIPAKHMPHDPKNWADVPKDHREKVIKRYGTLEKADEQYSRDDYNRMVGVIRSEWSPLVLSVSVKWDRFTMAERKRGGIESDAGENMLRQIEDALTADALDMARTELLRIKELLCRKSR